MTDDSSRPATSASAEQRKPLSAGGDASLAEAEARRQAAAANAKPAQGIRGQKGPEPTRYGDGKTGLSRIFNLRALTLLVGGWLALGILTHTGDNTYRPSARPGFRALPWRRLLRWCRDNAAGCALAAPASMQAARDSKRSGSTRKS